MPIATRTSSPAAPPFRRRHGLQGLPIFRALPGAAVLSLPLLAGCAGLRPAAPGPVSDSELDEARAVAHYATAVIEDNLAGETTDRAIDEYMAALRIKPASYRPYARTAATLLSRQKLNEAIAVIEKAVARNPRSIEARTDLAVMYEAASLPGKATRQYSAALDLNPRSETTYCQAARACFSDGRDRAAVGWLLKGHRLAARPEVVSFYCYSRGMDFAARKDTGGAVVCFEALMKMKPSDAGRIQMLIAEFQAEAGNTNAAIRRLRAVTDGPNPGSDAFIRLAAIEAETDAAKAAGTLERGMERLPGDPSLLFALAAVYSAWEKYDRATECFGRAEAAAEDMNFQLGAVFFLQYGAAHERAGRIGQAAEVFKRGLASHPDDHRILNYLAYMWADANMNLAESEAMAERAVELDPENGAYADTLGWVYFRQGRHREALDLIRRADTLLPQDPTILDHLGDVFAALDNGEEAIRIWRRSHQIDPSNVRLREKLTAHGADPSPAKPDQAPIPGAGGGVDRSGE